MVSKITTYFIYSCVYKSGVDFSKLLHSISIHICLTALYYFHEIN